MGFFGKIKQNFKHGGVKVTMLAPESAPNGTKSVQIQATIAASDSAQLIKSVTATLETHYFSDGNNNVASDAVISRQDYTAPFQLQPEQTVTLNFEVPTTTETNGPAMQALAHTMDMASKLTNMNNRRQFKHYLRVKADVDGISMDPEAYQQIRLEGHEQSHIQFTVN